MKTTIELNEIEFDQVALQGDRPVLVDFWAEWCGPCKMLAPVLDEIARETEGRAIVAKVNVDEHPALAARFALQGIPTLLYFSGGKLRGQTVGLVGKKAILARLTSLPTENTTPPTRN